MHLIVGLGNPGPEYAGHRHNIGFMAADAIAAAHGFSPFRTKFSALVSEGTVAGQKVLLLKPQTYMNRSGDAVSQAARFYKLAPADITVLHDELDLAPGKVRVKTGGGHGGHNGLKSIESHLGKEFRRVRLGIGHPGHKDRVTPHVLSDFHKVDRDWLDPLLETLAANAGLLVAGEEAALMNKLAPAAPARKKPAPEKSHIRQARPQPEPELPRSGPLADMLARLFKK